MVFTQKIVPKKTPPGGLDAFMEDVNPFSPEHARPSHVREGDASNTDNQEGDLNNQHDHISKDRDAKNEEEDDDGEYVKDRYYKYGYHYERTPKVVRVSRELLKTK
uniref:Uncharacterized protein n=1 Tax=Cannabis sativa TaxID=3483 RepID=A0A803Q830_CANSA